MLFNVDASSTLEVKFGFDVVDVYSAADERVSVSRTSDTLGEGVEISDVSSDSQDTPDPTSGTFRGESEVSSEAAGAAAAAGVGGCPSTLRRSIPRGQGLNGPV